MVKIVVSGQQKYVNKQDKKSAQEKYINGNEKPSNRDI